MSATASSTGRWNASIIASTCFSPIGRNDPMSMNAGDMVRVRQGRREIGKIPGTGAAYCREFYRNCPWANAIIMTRPPHAMAFATKSAVISRRAGRPRAMFRPQISRFVVVSPGW